MRLSRKSGLCRRSSGSSGKGHVAANLNVGNGRARLIDVLTQLLPFIGYPRTLNALRVLDEVTATPKSKETL